MPPPSDKARAQALAILTQIQVRAEPYQGPIPHPDMLRAFDALVPGSAEKIINQMIKQSDHRMSLEQFVIRGDSRRADWGVVAGVIVTIAAFALAGLLVMQGLSLAGLGVFVASLAGLIGVFVYGAQLRKAEREEARKQKEAAEQAVKKQR